MEILKRLRGDISTVGLDIGSYSVKLAKITHAKGEYFLEAAGVRELESGIVEGGEIKDRDGLIDAITTLVNQCDPSIVDVVISMSGQGIISDKFNFEIDLNDNVEETILWEAGQRSPFDVDDITLDYKILRELPDSNEIEVLLVAAKNQIMQKKVDLLYEAGLRPVVVDVDAFAISNCYSLEETGEVAEGTVALVNIGHTYTNISFVENGVYHSTRDVTTAGAFFRKTLQRNLGVSQEDATNILKGNPGSSHDAKLIRQSIEFAAEELSSGIDLAFSYFRSSSKSESIDRMVVSGGGAYIPFIQEFLADRHKTSVAVSNPLAYLRHDPNLFGPVNPREIAAFLTVAVGLALRKVTD